MTALYGSVRRLLLSITGCVAVTSLGYGAQPPDVVVSDAYGNTAMGTNALFSVTYGNSNTPPVMTRSITTQLVTSTPLSGTGRSCINMTGSHNSAFGGEALESNSTGQANAAFGTAALVYNNADNNTGLGTYALFSNTSGGENTASGASALASNTTGSYNTASGYKSLYSNTHGNVNAALGEASLYNNTSGSSNAVVGYGALYRNSAGSNNIAWERSPDSM